MERKLKEQLFNYPEYAEVGGKKYKINTDFRVAIQCNEVSAHENDPVDAAVAIIYLLFGEEAAKETQYYDEFMEKAIYFLQCGKEQEKTNAEKQKEPDMDFVQDMPYIEASFMSDYHIDLSNIQMHWWKFYYLISGLSSSEMGNCCVLNRIRSLRNMDTKDIKDPKERKRIIEAKKMFALKKEKKEKTYSQQELDNMEAYHKLIGE